MKFWDALEAMKRGWKIKRPHHNFRHTNDRGISFGCSHITLDDINADDWEILKEPQRTYSFQEIIPFLKEGKVVKRRCWESKFLKGVLMNGFITIISTDGRCGWLSNKLEDYEATDWVVCDEMD